MSRHEQDVSWLRRRLDGARSLPPYAFDVAVAVVLVGLGVASVFGQSLERSDGTAVYDDPGLLAALTATITAAPIAFRRRAPLAALAVSVAAIFVHILAGWPEGMLPFSTLFLTYTVGAWRPLRPALAGLAVPVVAVVILGIQDAPGLDTLGTVGVIAQFAAATAIGVALRSRRSATDSRVREAEERAEAEGQRAARVLAEERLRIAQELHDVVAHSISVIAVQAGVGAHVIDDQPEAARNALSAISATSRQTLAEMRRLLGMLRDDRGDHAPVPAPGLGDIARLVDDVRSAGVPATLQVEGTAGTNGLNAGVELSAYRVVQEALTNVMKHAGAPTRVDVALRYRPGSIGIEVCDDGRGLSARPRDGDGIGEGPGHGLIGMRERVELWGGELSVGPNPGGGYRVRAMIPYGATE